MTFRLGLHPSPVSSARCALSPGRFRGSRWSLLNQAAHQLESTRRQSLFRPMFRPMFRLLTRSFQMIDGNLFAAKEEAKSRNAELQKAGGKVVLPYFDNKCIRLFKHMMSRRRPAVLVTEII